MLGIADQLDAAIGAAPPDAPALEPTLALGRSALRRRRITYAAGVVAATLVIGGTAWALAPDGGANARDDGQVVEQPADEDPWAVDEFVRFADDDVTVNPDAEVLERTVLKDQPHHTVALHLRVPWHGGQEYFLVAQPQTGLESARIVSAGTQGLTLVEWARTQLDGGSVFPEDDLWVAFDDGSHLEALYVGVRIVDQLPDPGLGENFAAPGDPTAVAEVVYEGTTYFLAVRPLQGRREIDGQAEAIPYRADQRIQTLAEFLDYARQQYVTNDQGGSEGVR